jgi:hypothetical protein
MTFRFSHGGNIVSMVKITKLILAFLKGKAIVILLICLYENKSYLFQNYTSQANKKL